MAFSAQQKFQIAGHKGVCARQARVTFDDVCKPPLPPDVHYYLLLLSGNEQRDQLLLHWGIARWMCASSPDGRIDIGRLVDNYPNLALAGPSTLTQSGIEELACRMGLPTICRGLVPVLVSNERLPVAAQLSGLTSILAARIPERKRARIAAGTLVSEAGELSWTVGRRQWKSNVPDRITVTIDPLPERYRLP